MVPPMFEEAAVADLLHDHDAGVVGEDAQGVLGDGGGAAG
jgi:hypothetical protein